MEYKQVLETFVRQTDTLIDLYVDGEVISTTEEHPFWVPNLGWVEAGDLAVGSWLQLSDGTVVDVDGVEKREGEFEVYNFKVEDFHTYFVSELGLLVHNADCSSRKQGGKYTEPTLPEKEVGGRGEVKIVHNYKSNDHAPAHVHIKGGGKETRIKMNGDPMPGDPAPTSKQQQVIDENWSKIKKDLKKIAEWIKYQEFPD